MYLKLDKEFKNSLCFEKFHFPKHVTDRVARSSGNHFNGEWNTNGGWKFCNHISPDLDSTLVTLYSEEAVFYAKFARTFTFYDNGYIGKCVLNEVLYRVPSLLAPLHVIRDKSWKLQSYPSCTDTSLGKSTLGTESRSGRFRAYANDFSLVK